jgi:hypothetical protein
MRVDTAVPAPHRWRFFRCGGFDQVRLDSADDLRHLAELDQKLWAVLGCPTAGLEFDERTLAMIDTDGDGRIRSPEILAAVRWACAMLKDPAVLFDAATALPLADIDDGHPDGARLAASARQILAYLGKPDAEAISVADAGDTARLFTPDHPNGDGIVPAALTDDEALATVIGEIIACCGGAPDRSGEPGITQESLERFFEQVDAHLAWLQQRAGAGREVLPLGADTAAAVTLFDAVQAKIDDYFTRCRLAAFDERATEPLNPGEAVYAALGAAQLDAASEAVAALPLALAAPGRPLPLVDGVNPAWARAIERLREEIVMPILGERSMLSLAEWEGLSARFAAYRRWLADKPDTTVATLDGEHLATIAHDGTRERLAALIEHDRNADTAAASVEAVERLARYHRDLGTLLKNFVSLEDFYGARRKAIFQAGTLYLDQRSCELCLRVADMDKHSALAHFSGTYLVYCQCVRKDHEPMTIVAALTGGDAGDMLVAGRNGLFYDREGRDWNATVVKLVEHPISVRQAFWSPYRRIGRMIHEQIQKFAAARAQAVDEKAAAGIAESAERVGAGPAAAAAAPFDIAKFAGIFAAIGLAIGAIGTALAAILTGLLALPWWQLPLVVAGVMLAISAPSMLLAYLKLRERNLAPLLDANGWAVNTRARINLPFGASLTGVAALPHGATRSFDDPYAERRRPWKSWLLVLVLLLAALGLWRAGVIELPASLRPGAVSAPAAGDAASEAPPSRDAANETAGAAVPHAPAAAPDGGDAPPAADGAAQ